MGLTIDQLNELEQKRRQGCVSVLFSKEEAIYYSINGEDNYVVGAEPPVIEILNKMVGTASQVCYENAVAYIISGNIAYNKTPSKLKKYYKKDSRNVLPAPKTSSLIPKGEWKCAERKIIGKVVPLRKDNLDIIKYLKELKNEFVLNKYELYSTKKPCFRCEPFIIRGLYLNEDKNDIYDFRTYSFEYNDITKEFSFSFSYSH